MTRAADHAILNGVTRLAVLDIIAREGYRLDERPFTVEEAKAAREAFLTSTTADVLPVVRIDGAPIGDGKPGPLSRKLRAAYLAQRGGIGMTVSLLAPEDAATAACRRRGPSCSTGTTRWSTAGRRSTRRSTF